MTYYIKGSQTEDIQIRGTNRETTTIQLDGLKPVTDYVIEVHAILSTNSLLEIGGTCFSTFNSKGKGKGLTCLRTKQNRTQIHQNHLLIQFSLGCSAIFDKLTSVAL